MVCNHPERPAFTCTWTVLGLLFGPHLGIYFLNADISVTINAGIELESSMRVLKMFYISQKSGKFVYILQRQFIQSINLELGSKRGF